MPSKAKMSAAASFSSAIREITRGGAEIYEAMLEISRDPNHPDRFRALTWLADRGMGKEPVIVETINSSFGGVDLEELTDEQLERLRSTLRELGAGVTDAEVVEGD